MTNTTPGPPPSHSPRLPARHTSFAQHHPPFGKEDLCFRHRFHFAYSSWDAKHRSSTRSKREPPVPDVAICLLGLAEMIPLRMWRGAESEGRSGVFLCRSFHQMAIRPTMRVETHMEILVGVPPPLTRGVNEDVRASRSGDVVGSPHEALALPPESLLQSPGIARRDRGDITATYRGVTEYPGVPFTSAEDEQEDVGVVGGTDRLGFGDQVLPLSAKTLLALVGACRHDSVRH